VINRMMNTAEKRVKRELFEDLERVRGKDALLYRIAEAAHKRPKGKVKDVILPVTDERTWQQLLREAKTKGPYGVLATLLRKGAVRDSGCNLPSVTGFAHCGQVPGALSLSRLYRPLTSSRAC